MATITTTKMSNPPSNSMPKMLVPTTRPYKDFLTPALHRRFTNAALLVLGACWAEAILMSSEFSLFWSWFPLGSNGMRTLMLVIPCLCVFIVRVANMHVGAKQTTSPLETFYQATTSLRTPVTFCWYVFSAWIYSEVYIWSRGGSLAWVNPGRAHERPRLNENTVIFRSIIFVTACVYAGFHLYNDYDRVDFSQTKKEGQQQVPPTPRKPVTPLVASRKSIAQNFASPESLQRVKTASTGMMRTSVNLVVTAVSLAPFLYFVLLRRWAYRWAYGIARVFIERKLPKLGSPHGLTDLSTLVFEIVTSVFLLGMLWELSNFIFGMFVAEEPLKKGLPLTAPSKDPNGTLLMGLKSKKAVPRSCAFWELSLICDNFYERRKTLYGEAERKGGSTWSQVQTLCLTEIEAVNKRIAAQDPAALVAAQREEQIREERERLAIKPLPKIANQCVQNSKDIYMRGKYNNAPVKVVGDVAKSVGNSPGASNPAAKYTAALARFGSKKLLGPDAQKRMTPEYLAKEGEGLLVQILRTPLGIPFRQTFARRVNAVVFGIPHSNAVNIVYAAKSLSQLAVCSLNEDLLGRVQYDMRTIILTFTKTISSVQKFTASLTPHWTDVEFVEQDRKDSEVDEVVVVLKHGLEEMLLVFGEYSEALGLTRKELREAREAAGGGGDEMVHTRR